MGSLLRRLLRWLGRPVRDRGHVTSVTNTIDMMGGPKHLRWMRGGLLHFSFVAVGLTALFVLRHREVTHGWQQVSALLLAASWAAIGPAFIWYYERYTLPLLNSHCRRHLADATAKRTLQRHIFSHPLASRSAKLFVLLWMGGVTYAFIGTTGFVQGYGIRRYDDPFWLMFLAGVLYLSFYSAIGCCFAFKAVALVRRIATAPIRPHLYHDDRVMGFSFIGDFALATNLMFASGWLFVPLLLLATQSVGVSPLDDRLVLIVSYAAFLAMLFFVPVVLIHRTIVRDKKELLQRFGNLAAVDLQLLTTEYDPNVAAQFEVYRAVISDTQAVKEWPLSLDVAVNFGASAIVLPILVGLIVVWLG
jgi:hypothetical protein